MTSPRETVEPAAAPTAEPTAAPVDPAPADPAPLDAEGGAEGGAEVDTEVDTAGASPPAQRSRGTVLVVDDEDYVRDSVATLLERRGFSVRAAASGREALAPETLDGADAVLLDLKMPHRDGRQVLADLLDREPHLPVVMVTGHGTVASAVDCLKAGAADYLLKPVDPDELEMVLERTLEASDLRREIAYWRRTAVASADGGEGAAQRPAGSRPLVGRSEAWREVLELATMAAPSDTPVLLLGESGTGKEEIARYIHRTSRRREGPFVPVNCAAIPAELFESEFFGHRRGAFTGAIEDRVGRFKIAHRGTLFLDEIDSLPLAAQAKVLRVLQDGQFERVGDSRSTQTDVRILSASNQDLGKAMEEGRFRSDLYYRIHVISLPIPPLRQRPADIRPLAAAFLAELSSRIGRPVLEPRSPDPGESGEGGEGGTEDPAPTLSPETLALLEAYDWPGNVRELRNVIERGLVLARGRTVEPRHLPEDLRREARRPAEESLELRPSLLAEERRLVETALRRAGDVRREAARLLGIDERNLSYYLRKHGL